jgi:CrcB protein
MIPPHLALGGAASAVAPYVQGWVVDLTGPSAWGAFAVNIAGSFALGLFLTATEERLVVPSEVRVLVAVGFIGSFTTFSTVMWESQRLLEIGDLAGFAANIVGSLVAGLAALYLGILAGRLA